MTAKMKNAVCIGPPIKGRTYVYSEVSANAPGYLHCVSWSCAPLCQAISSFSYLAPPCVHPRVFPSASEQLASFWAS